MDANESMRLSVSSSQETRNTNPMHHGIRIILLPITGAVYSAYSFKT